MAHYQRILRLPELLKKKSFFLFGPRSTGKTTLIRDQLGDSVEVVNLLESDQYLRLSARPSLLGEMIAHSKKKIVIIDEVQRVPELLNEVHHLIESKSVKFLLTGSSARKLKSGHSNLLAGRAWTANLFPLVYPELEGSFDLNRILRYGSLPQVYGSKYPEEELKAYVRTYLYEEIQAEGLVRKIPQFSRFLQTAALANGQLLNFAQLSSDCGVPASTLKEHFQILQDTLVGFYLPPWRKGKIRKSIGTAKFYFFDNGVTHALSGTRTIERNSDLFGKSLEQWLMNEVRAYLSYRRRDEEMAFWRSTHGDEVDLIIGDNTAIEIKSTNKVNARDISGLLKLKEEGRFKRLILVSQDKIEGETTEGVERLHLLSFLEKLWSDQIF